MQTLVASTIGVGKDLIILHGLFGNGKNWHSLATNWSKNFCVHKLDARNHGKSMAGERMDYATMAEDVMQYMRHNGINSACIVGHSMGGKTAMQLANLHPEAVEKLVILDITASAYKPHHAQILGALEILNTKEWENRKQARDALSATNLTDAEKEFLLSDLTYNSHKKLSLQLNLANIKLQYDKILEGIDFKEALNMPCLLLGGKFSAFVNAENLAQMQKSFNNFTYIELATGHWIHSQARDAVEKYVVEFCL